MTAKSKIPRCETGAKPSYVFRTGWALLLVGYQLPGSSLLLPHH